jgi:hypothetical protein
LVDVGAQLKILVHYGMTWDQIKTMGIDNVIISALSSGLEENSEPLQPPKIAKEKVRQLEHITKKEQLVSMIESVELELLEATKQRSNTRTKVEKLRPMVESMENDLNIVTAKLSEFLEKKKLIQTHLEPILKELLDGNKRLFKQEQHVMTVQERKRALVEELEQLNALEAEEREKRRPVKVLKEIPSSKSVIEHFGVLVDGSWFVPSDLYLPGIGLPSTIPRTEKDHDFATAYNFKHKDLISIIPKICAITRKQTNQFTKENYEIMLSYRPDHVDAWLGFASFYLNDKTVRPVERAQSALDVLERALGHNPDSVILWSVMLEMAIRVYVTIPDKIRTLFAKALQIHSLDPHFYWTYFSWETDVPLKIDFLTQTVVQFVKESDQVEKSQLSLLLFNCLVQMMVLDPNNASITMDALFKNKPVLLDDSEVGSLLELLEPGHRCTITLVYILFRHVGHVPKYLFYDAPNQTICVSKPFLIKRLTSILNMDRWNETVEILNSEAELAESNKWLVVLKLNLFHLSIVYDLMTWEQVLDQVDGLLKHNADSTELHRVYCYGIAKTTGVEAALDYIRGANKSWELVIAGIKMIAEQDPSGIEKIKSWIFENELRNMNELVDASITDSESYFDFLTKHVTFSKDSIFLIWYRFCLVSILEKEPYIVLGKKNLNDMFAMVVEHPQRRMIHEMFNVLT